MPLCSLVRSSRVPTPKQPFEYADTCVRGANTAWTGLAPAPVQHSIIIDSACNYDEVLAGGTALAQKYGYSYLYVECKAKDIGMLDERLRARSALRSQRRGVDLPPSDAGDASHGENGRALFQRWIDEPKRPDKNCIVVKSSGNLEECRDYILEQIHLLLSM